MPRKSLSFVLLSSVTSAEHATAIEGDLLEEQEIRGRSWFVVHVLHTTFALFGLALTRAPLRTLALSSGAVVASCLVCMAVDAAFFAPEAWLPSPLLGLAAIVVSAALIGAALAWLAGGLGVRASVATSVLLLLLFVVAQTVTGSAQTASGATFELSGLALKMSLGFFVYLAPLMLASTWVHARRL